MKLVLYSGGDNIINEQLDLATITLIGNKDAKFYYIPSQSDKTGKYFIEIKEHFEKYGLVNFICFDIDEEFDLNRLDELKHADVIFLSGGNTFYFLNSLRNRGIDKLLIDFVKDPNKVLIGMSAGAMIMTPTIENTYVYHQMRGDANELNKVGLKDFEGLGCVNFEFIPHYSEETKGDFIQQYINQTNNLVYACNDGSGIIVENDELSLFGVVKKLK